MRGIEILGVTGVQVGDWGVGVWSFSVASEVWSSNLGCKNLIWGVVFFLGHLFLKVHMDPHVCLPHKYDNDVALTW
jgi:hypothetical protein